MSETEDTQTANTVDLHCGAAVKLWVGGWTGGGECGEGVMLTPQGGEFTNVCFSNGKRLHLFHLFYY